MDEIFSFSQCVESLVPGIRVSLRLIFTLLPEGNVRGFETV
jgi:hypothetical protein